MRILDYFTSKKVKGKSISNWIDNLSGTDSEFHEAFSVLVEAGGIAIPEVVKNLDSSNDSVRNLVPLILSKMGSDADTAVPALEPYCDNSKATVRIGVRFALINITGDPEPHLTIIADALEEDDPISRRSAALALKNLGSRAEPVGERIFNMVRREVSRDNTDQLAYEYATDALEIIGAPHPYRF